MRTAFVFQGGGSIAATQVGMLRALTKAGIRPDLVVGCSAGAINAVGFALEPTLDGIERLETLWRSVKRKSVFPVSAWTLAHALIGRAGGVSSHKALRRLLERELGDAYLDRLVLPAHVVATDVASGDPVVLSEGPTVRALLATTALPGVFPPVDVGGTLLYDGGIAAATPVLQTDALGAEVSYVLPSLGQSAPESVPRGAAPVVLRALSQLLGHASLTAIAGAHHEVRMLPAPSLETANLFDFRDTPALIEEGERLVSAWLDDQAAAGDRHPSRIPARADTDRRRRVVGRAIPSGLRPWAAKATAR
ncbi:patatin-like phospholipase family protein [Actinomadura sp. HBU206391]|uniref:patatin-like phospholipase family protein n=1 Tax=Actinomadura sp. HBU206391 TaxID=2731692 RepID=UPI001650ACE0|nr:patatin-like phospholipase family protein [Actinomadura sp. HBU206391]MBC6456554.1 patatin-like phospholipase family protein [Actinomadura sp. HBU206391]